MIKNNMYIIHANHTAKWLFSKFYIFFKQIWILAISIASEFCGQIKKSCELINFKISKSVHDPSEPRSYCLKHVSVVRLIRTKLLKHHFLQLILTNSQCWLFISQNQVEIACCILNGRQYLQQSHAKRRSDKIFKKIIEIICLV